MSDKGIIFSAAMVRALLAGRKTQTRRIIRPPMKEGVNPSFSQLRAHPHGAGQWMIHGSEEASEPFKVLFAPGDRLYVREACWIAPPGWTDSPVNPMGPHRQEVAFKADDRGYTADAANDYGLKLRPSIHMPRWASRLWLEVKDVRVERVSSISEADAEAEGIHFDKLGFTAGHIGIAGRNQEWSASPIIAFANLWRTLHTNPGERWEDDPWVVAVTFDVHHGNIDQ